MDEDQDNEPQEYTNTPTIESTTSLAAPTTGDSSEAENEPPRVRNKQHGRSRYKLDDDDEVWLARTVAQPPRSRQQVPLTAHIYTGPETVPMKVLLKDSVMDAVRWHAKQEEDDDDDDGFGDLLDALQAVALSQPEKQSVPRLTAALPASVSDPTYAELGRKEQQVHAYIQQKGQVLTQENTKLSQFLQSYIDKERQEAEQIQAEHKRQAEVQARREAKEKEEAQKRQQAADAAQKEKDAKDAADAARQQEEARVAAERKEKQDKEKAQAARQRQKEAAFMDEAQKMMEYLDQVRQSIVPFEKSKDVGKRRLAMKRVVNGRVNTLSEDAAKIQAVAADVNAAIAQARQDDAAAKAQVEAGTPGFSKEMYIGKRYFLNELCTNVVKRVQSDKFNGERGDGFPLANMLTQVAKENKDLAVILQPHVYKVCPTAIPMLPIPAKDASEEELMESLGMQKDSDGNYETFERFLSRTESIVSIMADIQSSTPPDHGLFGGAEGALKWLGRFLQQLPSPPQSPLPLLTAPVLDAFLTGAGHMLANCYADDFKKLLNTIEKDVLSRLDEAIGAPAAIRLRKTMEGGFDGFKANLPNKALRPFYHGAAAGQAPVSSSSSNPFGSATSQPQASTSTSAFGSTANTFTSGSPFGNKAPLPSPFRGIPASSSNPFGNTPAPSPFGASNTPAPASSMSSPFGSSKAAAPSPFGTNNAPATMASPFGNSNATAPSPFGSTNAPTNAPASIPFGTNSATTPSPFGASNAPVSAPSPFGASNAPVSTGGIFGGSSPFGSNNAPAPSPFGTSNPPVSAPSPFGKSSSMPSPFGASNAPAPMASPFGASNPPASAPSPFGGPSSMASPFGASNAPTSMSSPFGTSNAPAPMSSPFGTMAPTPSPFGNPPAPAASPFGSTAPAPAGGLFGGASTFGTSGGMSSPFGGASSATQSTGFAGNNNNNKQPCKYFAKGQCKFGNQCRFSHNIQPASTSFSNPFGGPRR